MYKKLIPPLWITGTVLVCYGMLKDNNPLFLTGIICITAGYIILRTKLKDSLKNKNRDTE